MLELGHRKGNDMLMVTVGCILACILMGQYFWISDTMHADGFSMNIQLLIAWSLACYLTPYDKIKSKSLMFIFSLSYLWDAIAFYFPPSRWLIIINISLFGGWLFHCLFRKNNFDDARNNDVFLVAKEPDDRKSFLLSLIGKPVGGYGISLGGSIYYFRHGKFIKLDHVPSGVHAIKTRIKKSDHLIEYLNSKLGSKWSWYNNCMTVLFGAWRAS